MELNPEVIQSIITNFIQRKQQKEFCYKEFVVKSFNKFIRDELSAASGYVRLAQKCKTKNIQEELLDHAKEEFDHYNQLIDYAYKHGFGDQLILCVDNQVVNELPNDDNSILMKVQDLETKAIRDYKILSCLSMKHKDLETHQFFMELMNDEQKHFDDLANYLNQHRELGS